MLPVLCQSWQRMLPDPHVLPNGTLQSRNTYARFFRPSCPLSVLPSGAFRAGERPHAPPALAVRAALPGTSGAVALSAARRVG
eukprot:scaffold16934_cov91-Isochrysis_galbana.AAC.1